MTEQELREIEARFIGTKTHTPKCIFTQRGRDAISDLVTAYREQRAELDHYKRALRHMAERLKDDCPDDAPDECEFFNDDECVMCGVKSALEATKEASCQK